MVLVISYLNRKISLWALLRNWAVVFTGNLVACVSCAWLFGYVTELFSEPMYESLSISIAEKKGHLDFVTALVRAIPANALVCICIYFGALARDVSGKIIGMHLPISKAIISIFWI